MGERTTGVLIGGIIALIGALGGLWATFAILGAAGATIFTFLVPTVNALYAWLILLGSILAIIFSIMMIVGKYIKWSTILVFIGGIISILVVFGGGWLYFWPGVLELLGAIIAMATGALS